MKCTDLIIKLSEHISKFGDGAINFDIHETESGFKTAKELELLILHRHEIPVGHKGPIGISFILKKI